MKFHNINFKDGYTYDLYLSKNNGDIVCDIPIEYVDSSDLKFNDTSTISLTIPKYIVNEHKKTIKNPNYDLFTKEKNITLNDEYVFTIRNFKETDKGKNNCAKVIQAISKENKLGSKWIEMNGQTLQIKSDDVNVADGVIDIFAQERRWKIGYIDNDAKIEHVNGGTSNKYRWFDNISKYWLPFLREDCANAFKSLFLFDTFNKEINVYNEKNIGTHQGLYLDMDNNFIKTMERTSNNEEIYTGLIVKGTDNLDISGVNPNGTNKVEKYDCYFDEMSPELVVALNKYKDITEEKQLEYLNLKNQKSTLNEQLNVVNNDLTALSEQLKLANLQQKQALKDNIQYPNLLKNSQGLDGINSWRNNGLETVWLPSYDVFKQYCPFTNKNGFGLYKNSAGEGFLESDTISVIAGQTYSFSGLFAKESNVSSGEVFIIGSANNDRGYGWASKILDVNGWNQGYNATFTVPNNINYIFVRIDHNGGTYTDGGIVLWTTNLRLIVGEDAVTKATNDINSLNSQITSKIATRVNIESQMTDIDNQITAIGTSLNKETCKDSNGYLIFDSNLLDELDEFTYEKEWSNEYYFTPDGLYKGALDALDELQEPPIEFSIESEAFVNLIQYPDPNKPWNKILKLGDFVTVNSSNLGEHDVRLIGINYTPRKANKKPSLKLTFSNKPIKYDDVKISSTINKANTSKTVLDSSKKKWNDYQVGVNFAQSVKENGLNLAAQQVAGRSDITKVDIDKYGILLTDAENENNQCFIGFGMYCITDSAWKNGALTCIDSSGFVDSKIELKIIKEELF